MVLSINNLDNHLIINSNKFFNPLTMMSLKIVDLMEIY